MTRSITFDRFELGLDLRKGPSTSDANRLRVAVNAYVTEGRTIRKRHGCVKVATLEAGTTGLAAGLGKLNTFYGSGTITHANTLFVPRKVPSPTTGTLAVAKLHFADVFNGYIYACVEYTSGEIKHHYLDTNPTTAVSDVNCPHSKIVTKTASKIWSGNGDTVRFSATNAPRDWTTANDAGFLPVGLQQSGSRDCTALGTYKNRLVAFFPDSSQIWQVDVDPANHKYLQSVDIGTQLPSAHENMAGDVFFLSPGGVKSITRQDQTDNLIDDDVGSPVDRLVLEGSTINTATAKAAYYQGGGQYWLYSGTKALIYTFSRSSSVSAWSVYEFPFSLDYLTELDAQLYIRSGNDVYRVDRTVHSDDGTLFGVEIELAFLDFKSPGVLKQIQAMDAVITGSADISHRFDPRNPELVTQPSVTISGDSRPGSIFPVELLATNMAPVIHNRDNADFELHALTYYFDNLFNG